MQSTDIRPLFAPVRVNSHVTDAGIRILSTPSQGGLAWASIGEALRYHALAHPERTFLAQRDGLTWKRTSFGQAWYRARSIGQRMLGQGANAERPVAILSENSIDHALVMLGAMLAGVPVSSISPSYSKLSSDFGKLKHTLGVLTPRVLYVDSATVHERALAALNLEDMIVVASDGQGAGVESLADWKLTPAGGAIDEAMMHVDLDTVAKVLFTSGSTGLPKGVIHTHRMMLSNQHAIAQAWPFLHEEPPVLVDWLPWNHVFGGNQNFNMALCNGGTLFVDPGKPSGRGIEDTVAALLEIAPTVYFNVPRGFDMLLPHLERDERLCKHFFSRLRLIGYAGAALPQPLWDKLGELGERVNGRATPITALWGSTETAPVATLVHFETRSPGNVGVPLPGTTLKMVPNQGKWEVRVKGPGVTPGYWRSEELTAAAFDEQGFYMIGDAMRLEDEARPSAGLLFDGRIGENFKLSSGTWVNVGALRIAAVNSCPSIFSDAVVAGHNKDYVALMIFPKIEACRDLVENGKTLSVGELLRHPDLVIHVRGALRELNAGSAGSSTRVARAVLLEEPPVADANEITDKGYLNQRAVLERRASLVDNLFVASPGAGVVLVD